MLFFVFQSLYAVLFTVCCTFFRVALYFFNIGGVCPKHFVSPRKKLFSTDKSVQINNKDSA